MPQTDFRRFLLAMLLCAASAVACSPAGSRREIRDGDRTIQISLAKNLQFSNDVIGVAWSRDGRFLATAAVGESHIKVWRTGGWTLQIQIPFGLGGSFPMQFSRDGNFLITRSDGSLGNSKAIFVFDVKTGGRVFILDGWDQNSPDIIRNTASSLTLNKAGDRLFVVFNLPHANPQICAYDTGKWTKTACWASNGAAFSLVAGVGDHLISARPRGQVQIWSGETQAISRSFQASTTDIRTIEVDPLGRFIATGQGSSGLVWDEQAQKLVDIGDNEGLRLWNYATGEEIARAKSLTDISTIAIDPAGRILASISPTSYEAVSLYRATDLAELGSVDELSDAVSDSRFGGDKFLSVAAGKELRIYAIQG